MQCALSSHKLYKLNGGKDTFLYFLLDVSTHLFNAQSLKVKHQGWTTLQD